MKTPLYRRIALRIVLRIVEEMVLEVVLVGVQVVVLFCVEFFPVQEVRGIEVISFQFGESGVLLVV